jgi:hypothetical protein
MLGFRPPSDINVFAVVEGIYSGGMPGGKLFIVVA